MEEKTNCKYRSSIYVNERLMKHIKDGIYKELHSREILTDTQLNSLLGCRRQSAGGVPQEMWGRCQSAGGVPQAPGNRCQYQPAVMSRRQERGRCKDNYGIWEGGN